MPKSAKNRSCSLQKRTRPPPLGAIHSNVPKLSHALKRSAPQRAFKKKQPFHRGAVGTSDARRGACGTSPPHTL